MKAGRGAWVAGVSLAVAAGAAVAWPGVFVLWGVARGVGSGAGVSRLLVPDWVLLTRTAGVAGLIAVMAVALAWPAAWAGRAMSSRGFILLMLPLLLPSYLVYSGWGLLRAPGTWLGDWLMRPGNESLVIPASRVLAVLGLALWAWPLAAVLIAVHLRRIDPDVFDALRLAPVPRRRYWGAVLGLARGGAAAALGVVFLLMLGSAVPLHVAQLDTYAIALWRTLDESPHTGHWQVWVAAWPLVALAGAAAWWMTTRLSAESSAMTRVSAAPAPAGSRAATWAAGVVWTLAVLAPAALFISNLHGVRPLLTFWRVTWRPLVSSAEIAAACGVAAVWIAGAVWVSLGSSSRAAAGAARASLFCFLLGGLAPGILVGSATAHAWAGTAVGDSSVVIVLAHVARFGFVAALAGWWLERTEPRELRDLRRLDAGDSLRGWAVTALIPQAGVIAAAGLAVALLSFHEIEATVMLQPPSAAGGGFAWVMLQQLHFARTQELAAGTVYVLGAALVVASGAAWALRRSG